MDVGKRARSVVGPPETAMRGRHTARTTARTLVRIALLAVAVAVVLLGTARATADLTSMRAVVSAACGDGSEHGVPGCTDRPCYSPEFGQGRPGDRVIPSVDAGSRPEFVCRGRTGRWEKAYPSRPPEPMPVGPSGATGQS